MPCTFDTLMARIPQKVDILRKKARDLDVRDFELFDLETRSGLTSNDGRGSNLLPARSDGLDNVDGSPDAAFYIQMRVIEQVSIRSRF